MIAHLKGRLDSTGIDHAVIDVGGVGYLVGASARTLAATGGYSTGQGTRLEGSWTHRNLFPPEGALIGTAKSFSDPRNTIRDALPGAIANLPDTAVTIRKVEDQTQTQTPVKDEVIVTKKPEQ